MGWLILVIVVLVALLVLEWKFEWMFKIKQFFGIVPEE